MTSQPLDVVLSLACADRPGLVAAVSTFVAEHGGNITESQQFGDTMTGDFFMRVAFADEGGAGLDALREGFAVRLLTDTIAGVAPETTQAALAEMAAAGATTDA